MQRTINYIKKSLVLLLLFAATVINSQTDSAGAIQDNPNVSPFSKPKYTPQTKKTKQWYPYPKNIVDLGLGAGPNYGLFGTKTVLGFKGNGLMLGLGFFDGSFAFQVGAQGCYKWFYANFSYGTVAAAYVRSSSIPTLLSAPILGGGFKINLANNKKVFLEAGMAYAFGPYYKRGPYTESLGGPRLLLGLGLRLFDRRKKAEQDHITAPEQVQSN